MKKLFDKENFYFSSFDKGQKRQSFVTSILIIVCFAIASFTFFNAFYGFVDIIGSIISGSTDVAIKDLLRSLPLIFTFLMCLWTLFLLHAQYRNNKERRFKSLFKDSICLLVFVAINFIYVMVGRITGKYLSLVEGSPSPFYPLDTILFSLLFVAIAILVIRYVKKEKAEAKYVVPERGEVVKKARGLYNTFMTIWLLIALFGFSASIFSIFIYDFMSGYVFYGLMVIIAFALPFIFLGVWEFYYNEMRQENKKEFLLPLAICGLVISVIVIALYFISYSTSLDAQSNAGFGMFPVGFAASVNIATFVVVFTPLIVSIIALIKGLVLKFKK